MKNQNHSIFAWAEAMDDITPTRHWLGMFMSKSDDARYMAARLLRVVYMQPVRYFDSSVGFEMGSNRHMLRSKRLQGFFCLALLFCSAVGQVTHPVSLDLSNGVHIYAYDEKEHKDVGYYTSLCRVILKEFGLPSDTIPPISLVFVSKELRDVLNDHNIARFNSADWCGAFVKPSLIIMLGEEESDDTFMHEYLHFLQQEGLLFTNVHTSAVHRLIEENEGLLLGSKSYLEFLKTRVE